MAWGCLATGLVGFGGFYIGVFQNGLGSVPVRLHIHGAIMMAWLVLFTVQGSLPGGGRTPTHRQLGRAGLPMFVLVMVSIVSLSINSLVKPMPPVIDEFINSIFSLQVVSFILAPAFFVMAMRAVTSDTAAHRRYLLLMTILLLEAGVFRMTFLPGISGTPGSSIIPMHLWNLAMAAPLVVFDFRTLGRLHRATSLGLGLIVVLKLWTVWAWSSPVWQSIAIWLEGLLVPFWPVH